MNKPSPSRQRKRLTPEERTHEILDAAMRIVIRDGVGKMTMEIVAKEAGVSKGLIYAYFPNLTALLQQVYVRENQQLHRQHLSSLKHPHTFESMVKITASINRASQDDRRLLIKRLASEPSIAAAMAEEDQRNRFNIVKFLSHEIIDNFDIPVPIAQHATALALRYDPETTGESTYSTAQLDDIWGAMMVGAMKELEKRYGQTREKEHG
ncbi:MAG: helix-turn-helix domain-containing protein [Pseudomonadota bacterium]